MTSSYNINNQAFLFINDIIPHTGHFNMEFDQWLFELVEKNLIKNALRIYEWKCPAISYGRSQQIEKEIDPEACRKDNIELIKRMTGGRAILHFHEITFSMVFQPHAISPYNFRNAFLFAADRIVRSFSFMNIKACISLKPEKYQNKSICFQSTAQYEIIDEDSHKLVGIAQYFTPRGVLIQGSIPLKDVPEYKEYFNVKNEHFLQNKLIESGRDKEQVRNALIKGFQKELKLINMLEMLE